MHNHESQPEGKNVMLKGKIGRVRVVAGESGTSYLTFVTPYGADELLIDPTFLPVLGESGDEYVVFRQPGKSDTILF